MLFMLTVSFILVVYSAQGFPIIYEGCVAISVLVHYFTLASVMWMGAEALLMFKKLVLVFSEVTAKFIISVSIVCWSTYVTFNLLQDPRSLFLISLSSPCMPLSLACYKINATYSVSILSSPFSLSLAFFPTIASFSYN